MTQAVVLYAKGEAERETAWLRASLGKVGVALETIKQRLVEAERREVWRAMGYRSMAAYMVGALGIARSTAHDHLDQIHAAALIAPAKNGSLSVRRRTESDHLPTVRQARQITAPLKQKRQKRGIPTVEREAQAISEAIDRFEARTEGVEDDELVAYLSGEQRRLVERAVTKATEFADRWGALLSRPVRLRRDAEESA